MRLSARVDYALRAMSELAAADAPRTVEQLSEAQRLPNKYLESILGELRRTGLLRSQRGPEGGYRLARPAETISCTSGSSSSACGSATRSRSGKRCLRRSSSCEASTGSAPATSPR